MVNLFDKTSSLEDEEAQLSDESVDDENDDVSKSGTLKSMTSMMSSGKFAYPLSYLIYVCIYLFMYMYPCIQKKISIYHLRKGVYFIIRPSFLLIFLFLYFFSSLYYFRSVLSLCI